MSTELCLQRPIAGGTIAGLTFNLHLLEYSMTIAELIAEAEATVIDNKKIDALNSRMQEVENEFEERTKMNASHIDFMSRCYSL